MESLGSRAKYMGNHSSCPRAFEQTMIFIAFLIPALSFKGELLRVMA